MRIADDLRNLYFHAALSQYCRNVVIMLQQRILKYNALKIKNYLFHTKFYHKNKYNLALFHIEFVTNVNNSVAATQ